MATSSSASPSAPVVDWSDTPLTADYNVHYVKIIDDAFSPAECAELIALAEWDGNWQQAAIHYGFGPDEQYVNTDYRNSSRILRFDRRVADRLYGRLKPYIQELHKIEPGDKWAGVMDHPDYLEGKWECVGINERLSFLKYDEGQFFATHCDGLRVLPDGRKARATVQIYLGADGVEGGATRIYSPNGCFYDVEPKKGRALIFQHRHVAHSGEPVTKGIKYTLRTDFMFLHTIDGQTVMED